MNAEKQRIAEALRRAGYHQSKQFVNETEQLILNLPSRPRRTAQVKALKTAYIAAALVLFLAFGMPWVVKAAEAIITHLFSQRAEQIERQLALPEGEQFRKLVKDNYGGLRSHALNGSVEFMDVTIALRNVSLMPDDRYNTGSTKGEVHVELEFSDIPAFDPNYMAFMLCFGGTEYPMAVRDPQKYFIEDGRRATPDDWNSWEGAGIGQLQDGVPCANVSFALADWRIDEKTDMVLSGSIDGRTFELPFTYDPALAHNEAEQQARESMTSEQRYNEQELAELRSMADGAGQVGYVKQAGPIEFTVSEISLSGDELFISMGYKGVNEKNPMLAAHTYAIYSIAIDGKEIGPRSWDHDQVENGTYTSVTKFELEDAGQLPEESLVYVKLYLGNKDGKDSHEFGDTSDYEYYGYAAFRYNWKTRTATLPKDEAQDAEWIAQSQQSHYYFDLPWRGDMMKHVDDGLELSVVHMQVNDGAILRIQPYVSSLRTWKHELEQVEFTSNDLENPVLTVNGREMPFTQVEYSQGSPDFLRFDLAGAAGLNQGDQCLLKMPVRVIEKGKIVFEQVFTFEFELGERKA